MRLQVSPGCTFLVHHRISKKKKKPAHIPLYVHVCTYTRRYTEIRRKNWRAVTSCLLTSWMRTRDISGTYIYKIYMCIKYAAQKQIWCGITKRKRFATCGADVLKEKKSNTHRHNEKRHVVETLIFRDDLFDARIFNVKTQFRVCGEIKISPAHTQHPHVGINAHNYYVRYCKQELTSPA